MKSKQLSATFEKAQTARAARQQAARTAKLEDARQHRLQLQQQWEQAAPGKEKAALERKLAGLDKTCDRLQYGPYRYKQQLRQRKEAQRQQRAAAKKQERLAAIDRQIARLDGQTDPADARQLARLQNRRKRVELGSLGIRWEKADAVQLQLEELQQQLRQTEQAITRQKTSADSKPAELKRLERLKARQQKKERHLKDRIHTLRQTRWLTIRRRKSLVGLSFVLPWIAGFAVFFLYPFVQSVRLSFGEITDMHRYIIEFTGLEHYKRLLFEENDVLFMLGTVLKDTFINMLLITVFAFYIAMLLNRKIRLRGVFRVICFLPVMLGTGFIMEQLLSQNIEQNTMQTVKEFLLPKEIITYIGPKITNAVIFFLNRITVILWKSGVQILIFLSGLQSIPSTLYEAAKVDSATEWENLWFITVPMMTPMILLNLVYTIVDSFIDASNPIITYIKEFAFTHHQESYAAAVAMFYCLIALLLVGLTFLVMRRFTKDMQS